MIAAIARHPAVADDRSDPVPKTPQMCLEFHFGLSLVGAPLASPFARFARDQLVVVDDQKLPCNLSDFLVKTGSSLIYYGLMPGPACIAEDTLEKHSGVGCVPVQYDPCSHPVSKGSLEQTEDLTVTAPLGKAVEPVAVPLGHDSPC